MTSGRDTETDAESLYEDAPCGHLSMTLDGVIVRANRTFLGWTGHDDLAGRRFPDLLTAGGRIYHETHFAPLIRMQGSAREIAVEIVAVDGGRLPALLNAVVKPDEAGEDIVRIAVFPATDRREYERELLRARRRAEESEARARSLAETLQASLIPPTPPQIPALDVGAAFRPAGAGDEVGGDFYDVFEVAQGDWAVVIGDVMGKGVRAAAVTALARYTLRAAAMQVGHPRLVLNLLNEAMIHQQVDTFCTVAYARVTRRDDGRIAVTVSTGGHALPIYVTNDGSSSPSGEAGTLIGVVPDPPLFDSTVTMEPGDVLAFYTDGVTEGRRGSEFFGEDRLSEVLTENRERSAVEIAEGVVGEVLEFQDDVPRDDIAVVVLKVPDEAEASV